MREWIVPDNDIGVDGAYFDYQELLRCKDCKWHWKSKEWHSTGYCENDKCFDGFHFETNNDFYCGYAERNEE